LLSRAKTAIPRYKPLTVRLSTFKILGEGAEVRVRESKK
jgi:hypothetical protein